MLDYLILGAGPAGLQLGYFLGRAGRSYRILEAGEAPGTFFRRFPRHRTLISSNKVFTGFDDPEINLRWDWNSLLSDDPELVFSRYSKEYFPPADAMLDYLADFARRHRLEISYDTRVTRVSRRRSGFVARAAGGGEHHARRLIVATGVSRSFLPAVPGIELAEPYAEVSIDRNAFENRRVLILGKGNSAFETADHLVPAASLIHLLSPNPVQMAWKTHFVGHLRAVNNNLLDTYQLKSQNAVLDADLQSLRRLDDGRYAAGVAYRHASGEVEELIYDRVIACTGFAFDDSIFDRTCRPELAIHDRFPRQTSTWESVNVPGLYFAGTLTQERDYRQTTSAFIHGFRYNTRALHRILEVEHHGGEWPSRDLGTGPASVRDAVIERVNRTSALWQQFGFLADLVVVGERGVRYYEEVPVDYADGGCQMIVPGELYFLVTLEYGVEELTDPFNVERIARDDVDRAEQSRFLHPIVRGFRDGEQVSEHHVIEDLTAEWVEPIHTEPLGDFFARELAAPPPAMAREQARA